MTTTTLPLAEFLLARYDELEAPTYELVPYACDPGCCAPAGWVGHRCLICGTPAEYGGTVQAITEVAREHEEQIHQRSYVLADIEAKRRIVEIVSPARTNTGAVIPGSGLPDVLRALAQPFRDHPDWRAEWDL